MLYHAFGVRKGYEYRATEYVEGRVEFHLRVEKGLLWCPDCGSASVHRRGARTRRIRSVPIGLKRDGAGGGSAPVPLSGVQQGLRGLPPFARAYVRYSLSLARLVCELSRLMPLIDVAALTHLGWGTVKEIVKEDLAVRYKEVPLRGVKRIAIDEIHIGAKAKFYTLVIDLESSHIIHVAKGRGAEALRKFWRRVRKSKARIEAAACDMAAAYWSAILENLPKAALVFDHFHIVKLANEKIDQLRRALWREADILILNYFHFPISSGKLEGINNKIACLKRAAYGWRNNRLHELVVEMLARTHGSSEMRFERPNSLIHRRDR